MIAQIDYSWLVGSSFVADIECVGFGNGIGKFYFQVSGKSVFSVGREVGQGDRRRSDLLHFPHAGTEIRIASVCSMPVGMICLQAIFFSVEHVSCMQDASDISSYGSSIILWLAEITVYIRKSADDVLQLTVAVGHHE